MERALSNKDIESISCGTGIYDISNYKTKTTIREALVDMIKALFGRKS